MKFSNKHSQQSLADSTESNYQIYSFLKSHPVGVLSTVDPNGNPHAVVIYFSIEDDFSITFTTKKDTKKNDNIRFNDHVMLLAYEASSQTTVQITGVAEAITNTTAAEKAYEGTLKAARQTSETGVPPITKLYAGDFIAYRVKPVQIRMGVFIRPDRGGYDMYETIDFNP